MDTTAPDLSTLMDNLPGMAYRCLNDKKRTMLFVSEGGAGLTGYVPSALTGNRLIAFGDLIHEDYRENTWEQIQAALEMHFPFVLEYRIQTSLGKEKWVWEKGIGIFSDNGEVEALEGFIIDITQRKHAEQELKEHRDHLEELVGERTKELRLSEEKFKTLYNSSRDAIMMLEQETGFFNGNPATVKLFGCKDEEEFNSKSPSDLSPKYQPDGRLSSEKAREMIRIAMDNGSHFFEWVHKRINDEEFYANVLLTRMRLYGKEVLQANVRDITQRKWAEEKIKTEVEQRKYAEEQLKILVDDLERANKELESFAYIVSHDLKAPLRGISSLATWLAEDYGHCMDEEGKGYLEKLHHRTMRMHYLIEGILQYSCIGRVKTKPAPQDCGITVLDIIDDLAVPQNISVRIEGHLPLVTYDKTQLGQVFRNLIGNALKHMKKANGEVVISCDDTGENYEFCIKDNGIGIEKRHFERIFKVFQSLDISDKDSTGIGLALVKKIVEQNGGKVWVESTVGKGSRFFFTIPRKPNGKKRNKEGCAP